MAYWWVAPLVAGAVKTGIDAYTGYQKGKAQQSKIDDLSKITPEERDYVKRQRGIAEGGDPMIDQMYNQQRGRVIGDIRQGGAEARNLAVGQAVSQGLENSIISQELRRKADTSTLKQIGDASQRIAEANMRAQIGAKQSAQGSLDRFQLNRAQMLRNLGMQRPTNAGLSAEAWGTTMGGVVDAVGGLYDAKVGYNKAVAEGWIDG